MSKWTVEQESSDASREPCQRERKWAMKRREAESLLEKFSTQEAARRVKPQQIHAYRKGASLCHRCLMNAVGPPACQLLPHG